MRVPRISTVKGGPSLVVPEQVYYRSKASKTCTRLIKIHIPASASLIHPIITGQDFMSVNLKMDRQQQPNATPVQNFPQQIHPRDQASHLSIYQLHPWYRHLTSFFHRIRHTLISSPSLKT